MENGRMSYIRSETRTARKLHWCMLCLEPIAQGEKCLCIDKFGEGTVWTCYMHVHCSKFHEAARDEDNCMYCANACCYCFAEEIKEHFCEVCEFNGTELCTDNPIRCRVAHEDLKRQYEYGDDAHGHR